MEERKKGFLTDNEGLPSAVRLGSAAAFVVGTIFAFADVFDFGGPGDHTNMVLIYLTAAFAPKVTQKYIENMHT